MGFTIIAGIVEAMKQLVQMALKIILTTTATERVIPQGDKHG